MFDRDKFLLLHGACPCKWAKRWGIEPFTTECYRCGAPATSSIPFAAGSLRGLIAPVCTCGHPTPPYCVVRAYGHGDLFTGE